MPSIEPVASVRDLRVELTRPGRGHRAQTVLTGISLDIAPGEVLGLVGQSGSGKSILGLTMLGLLPEHSRPHVTGTVRVAGCDVLGADDRELRRLRRDRLGVVFQDPMTSLNPTMRVGEQVIEATGSKAAAIELLDRVGIPEPAERLRAFPHQLSGGMRQRVMIAMAVAGEPALIIADEPTTALDVTVQKQVLDLLGSLRSEIRCSVLMVTHDLGVAAEIADRIVVMRDGGIVESGPVDEVLHRPREPYTRALVASRISLESDRTRPLPTFEPDAGPVPASEAPVAEEVYPVWTPRPDRPVAVEASGLGKTFSLAGRKRLHALRDISFEVGSGESVAIVGESGSGKSTLLRIVAGLESADQGGDLTIAADGRPQMVFQDAGASLTPWMRVEELLSERLRIERVPAAEHAARSRHALELVGLDPALLRARPRELSGGQRQRVALARAAILPPSILLCDEPTSALDAWMAAAVINLLRRIRHEVGMSMIFVTHDLSVARLISDRIIVMRAGEIVEQGPSERVIAAPQEEYTRDLVAAVPDAVPAIGRVA